MRVRVKFSKSGPLVYIGNLDLHALWERAARRAGLRLTYSQGFHPQPKLHLAAPLPLGFSSGCELMDMRISEDVDCAVLPDRLNAVLPAGIRVLGAERVADEAPALQAQVVAADYEVTLRIATSATEMAKRVEALLAAEALPRERRSRRYDLRPLIESMQLGPPEADEPVRIRMRLRAEEGATGRPDEVLEALGISREDARIQRTGLHLRDLPAASSTEKVK